MLRLDKKKKIKSIKKTLGKKNAKEIQKIMDLDMNLVDIKGW